MHTKAEYRNIVRLACQDWAAQNPTFNRKKLTGRGHIKRSIIFNEGLSDIIPDSYKDELYFAGPYFTIVAEGLAEFLAVRLDIPVEFIATPMWD